MADLAETVKILREAGARATFYENGGLKSIAFTPKFDAPTVVLGPDGLPFVEPPKERTALDVVAEDPPQLEPDAEAAERYPLEEEPDEAASEPESRPVEVRDDLPTVDSSLGPIVPR